MGGSLKSDVLARNPATYKDWSRTWEQTTSGKEEILVGWIRDASVIESMGSVLKIVFFGSSKINKSF